MWQLMTDLVKPDARGAQQDTAPAHAALTGSWTPSANPQLAFSVKGAAIHKPVNFPTVTLLVLAWSVVQLQHSQ